MTIKRLVVEMSGATRAIYGIRWLEILKTVSDVEAHLVISNEELTRKQSEKKEVLEK